MRLLNIKKLVHHGNRVMRTPGRVHLEQIYSSLTKIERGDYLYRSGGVDGAYLFYEIKLATHQRTDNGWFSYVLRERVTGRKEIIALREKLDLLLTPVPD